ncbi:unnamed protein product [Nippostrongylus brasiliensis]|uniref:G_PROTEIN_RECEP_F1_2 domain-containing protein n=1 Tax=Nippostrongylus brasiliensis TaxID=27835 RepID=A0A158QYT9_NIPBR|nr:unnamed protein product [Nippostrongylus brasiliensis]
MRVSILVEFTPVLFIKFLFPTQFLVAVFGNSLTMSVLLSAHMKNRANHLLAFLAMCDILVFVMMLPHYLSSLDVFSRNNQFRLIHYNSKVHFAALTNWFSAAAIWFVLAVSVERLLIVKFPFRSLDTYNTRQIVLVSISILVGTFLLTSYHHVSHTCKTSLVCSGTQLIGGCYSNALPSWGSRPNPTSALTRQWIEVSVILNAVFAVLLPELLVHTVSTNPSAMHEQERKMTHTVLAIVTCFTLTQGPSALLVLTGKMLNIVLFCMTSSTFRRKLLQTCKRWIFVIVYCNRQSGPRSYFSRSQSKSVMTQKTSVYSPSTNMRSSIASEMSEKKRSRTEYSSLVGNGETIQ